MTDIEAAGIATTPSDDADDRKVSALWWCAPTLLFWCALIWVALS